VTTGADRGQGSVDIYSVPRLSRVAALRAPWGRWGRFTPDGHVLVVADHEGRLRLFDTATWKLRAPPVDAHSGEILSVAISPDGRTLATTSFDGTTRLWNTASGRQISDGLPGPPNRRSGAIFLRDGSRLLAAYEDGRALLWDLRPSTWTTRACSIAGRILTRAEWRDALPDRAYAPVCRSR
jgi:WD40 repeat protein